MLTVERCNVLRDPILFDPVLAHTSQCWVLTTELLPAQSACRLHLCLAAGGRLALKAQMQCFAIETGQRSYSADGGWLLR